MEYAELTGDVPPFTKQTASELKCKFKNNTEFLGTESYGLARKTWKVGILKKPYTRRNLQHFSFSVTENAIINDIFNHATAESSEDEKSEN